MPRFLSEILVDPYSTVRYIAQRSLKFLPGYADFSYDYIGPVAGRSEARQRALEIWRNQAAPTSDAAIGSQTAVVLNDAQVSAMLRQRNNRRMELLE